MEALVLLDREREYQSHRDAADQFWHGFLATVAARTQNPFDTLSKFMPELGLDPTPEGKPKEYPDEDKLPEPQREEIADLERWIRQNASGSVVSPMNGARR